jgi:hypothetical protein
MVADAVIAEYNELLAKDFAKMDSNEQKRLTDLEDTM